MKIRVGIIGCGSITEFRHGPEYKNNDNVEIGAFYDPYKERAQMVAHKFGGKVAESVEDILEDASISAISDCSTNETHHIITTKALQHGKHVLCEKPMATSVEEARKMVKASKESNKILMIDHNQRLATAHMKAKEIIKSGYLGNVLSFKTSFGHKGPEYWSANKSKSTWFFDKQRSVLGVAGDLGIHKIDLIRFLTDAEFTEVSASSETLHKKDSKGKYINVADNLICLLKMNNGSVGQASFSWTYYGDEDNSTILYCEKGILKIYCDPNYQIIVEKTDGNRELYELGEIQTNDNQTSTGVIDAFIDSIRNNRRPPITGEDGLESLKVIFALLKSSEEKRKIIL